MSRDGGSETRWAGTDDGQVVVPREGPETIPSPAATCSSVAGASWVPFGSTQIGRTRASTSVLPSTALTLSESVTSTHSYGRLFRLRSPGSGTQPQTSLSPTNTSPGVAGRVS